jgi:hypothetical protein
MMSVIMMSVNMMSIIMMSTIMMSVIGKFGVAPRYTFGEINLKKFLGVAQSFALC